MHINRSIRLTNEDVKSAVLDFIKKRVDEDYHPVDVRFEDSEGEPIRIEFTAVIYADTELYD